jgi:hypothetical protein
MLKMIQGFCALLLSLTLTGHAPAQTSTKTSPNSKLKLGYVDGGGCGCSLSLIDADQKKGRIVYFGDICERRPCAMAEPHAGAKINLDGKDLELQLAGYSKTKDASKVGARLWTIYTAGDVKVRVDWTVTEVCKPEDEGCEVTRYKAVMTITRKTERAIVETVGDCGC